MSLGGYNGFSSKRESGDCLDIMNVGKKNGDVITCNFQEEYLLIYIQL